MKAENWTTKEANINILHGAQRRPGSKPYHAATTSGQGKLTLEMTSVYKVRTRQVFDLRVNAADTVHPMTSSWQALSFVEVRVVGTEQTYHVKNDVISIAALFGLNVE